MVVKALTNNILSFLKHSLGTPFDGNNIICMKCLKVEFPCISLDWNGKLPPGYEYH